MHLAGFFFSLVDMKNPRCLEEHAEARSTVYGKNLVEEMRELRRLTTDFMMEKCVNSNGGVLCPKPSRQFIREETDPKIGPDPFDIIIASKASPPYYAGSPPVRSSNPLIEDVHFGEVLDGISCQPRASRSISSVA